MSRSTRKLPSHEMVMPRKDFSLTAQTLKMFPSMADLPWTTIRAASAIACGMNPDSLGFARCGAGVYTVAYANKTHVVKGSEVDEVLDGQPAENMATWLEFSVTPRSKSRVFRRMMKKYLNDTVVLFDCVVVQPKVEVLASAIEDTICAYIADAHRPTQSRSSEPVRVVGPRARDRILNGYTDDAELWRALCRDVTTMASMLLIDDMHEENWGFTTDGRIKMFDMAPRGHRATWTAADDRRLLMLDERITMYVRHLRMLNIL